MSETLDIIDRDQIARKPDMPDAIYLTCGHIIIVDGTSVSLDEGKEPLHDCCVKAIAGL
jgi:hypothetical protein